MDSPLPPSVISSAIAAGQIREYLRAVLTMRIGGRSEPPAGFNWFGHEQLLLEFAADWTPAVKPKRLAWATPRFCFCNSHTLCARSDRYVYCEGYCLPDFPGGFPFPVHHGWAVDRETGLVVDVTLREPALCYVGMAFAPTYRKLWWGKNSGNDNCSLFEGVSELLRLHRVEIGSILWYPPSSPTHPGAVNEA